MPGFELVKELDDAAYESLIEAVLERDLSIVYKKILQLNVFRKLNQDVMDKILLMLDPKSVTCKHLAASVRASRTYWFRALRFFDRRKVPDSSYEQAANFWLSRLYKLINFDIRVQANFAKWTYTEDADWTGFGVVKMSPATRRMLSESAIVHSISPDKRYLCYSSNRKVFMRNLLHDTEVCFYSDFASGVKRIEFETVSRDRDAVVIITDAAITVWTACFEPVLLHEFTGLNFRHSVINDGLILVSGDIDDDTGLYAIDLSRVEWLIRPIRTCSNMSHFKVASFSRKNMTIVTCGAHTIARWKLYETSKGLERIISSTTYFGDIEFSSCEAFSYMPDILVIFCVSRPSMFNLILSEELKLFVAAPRTSYVALKWSSDNAIYKVDE